MARFRLVVTEVKNWYYSKTEKITFPLLCKRPRWLSWVLWQGLMSQNSLATKCPTTDGDEVAVKDVKMLPTMLLCSILTGFYWVDLIGFWWNFNSRAQIFPLPLVLGAELTVKGKKKGENGASWTDGTFHRRVFLNSRLKPKNMKSAHQAKNQGPPGWEVTAWTDAQSTAVTFAFMTTLISTVPLT